ncbi:hypothetical protein E4631_17315 [Hymenobacter sp. UV11]|uniref:hypothetical protein n=1 Tax=Hymenobacter sp. UV11 TaxID=1849735 RepID=UPI0010601766|nr:hypothetical protein [Hymenobacter sp. UV11]TDN38513.1 hypothetical protein A8B98_23085 [Hymenobacter sp. UV11]TFZ65288.1 hypothetical protein E4631_17315 [Hymenobacter sp. UV11]
MTFYRYLLLPAVCLFCLTCLVACQNTAPADQLTVVQGTVTSYETGRPLPGVLMSVGAFSRGLFSRPYPVPTGDSVRTDAQGKYTLGFRNTKGLYYAITLEVYKNANYSGPPRYTFDASQPSDPLLGAGSWEVTVGKTNIVNFKPNELRTVAVRIRNRNTGYQLLDFNYRTLHGNALDTLAYLRGYYLPAGGVKFRYYDVNATNQVVKDTLVALVVQNPTALPPDTLRATLTFVR